MDDNITEKLDDEPPDWFKKLYDEELAPIYRERARKVWQAAHKRRADKLFGKHG